MKDTEELKFLLAKEIFNLWIECKIRCDRIEEITQQIKKSITRYSRIKTNNY